MITVVDYGSGNVSAIANIYKALNIPCRVSKKIDDIATASHLVLPGVGAFDTTISQLEASGLRSVLDRKVCAEKIPVLGICVGMQIMARSSEEGLADGLGWLPAIVKKFDISKLRHKPHLPHLGWNIAHPVSGSRLFSGVDIEKGFYFLHSFYLECDDKKNALAKSHYGIKFTSSAFAENVFGVQFHPEKSHYNGIQIFKNFAGF